MLAEDGVFTLEDFAGCVPDDLVGWNERGEGETIRHEGSLSATDMTAAEAENLIMTARLQLGWIEPEPEPVAEVEAEVAKTLPSHPATKNKVNTRQHDSSGATNHPR